MPDTRSGGGPSRHEGMASNAVLVLTDLVDSTQLNTRLGDTAMASLWAAHDTAARDLVRLHGGLEIGRSDGFLLSFGDAAAAVAFVRGYRALLGRLGEGLQARVGLHQGAHTLRMNSEADRALGATVYEVDGLALPTAARLMALAQAGQVLACQALRDAAAGAPGVWRDVGHWRLKGLPQPLRVHEWAEEAPALLGPPPEGPKAWAVQLRNGEWVSLTEVPHSLPAELDAFVGRGAALASLARLLDEGARLVTLLGTGGIGKTRLAVRAAWRELREFPGGTWFCDLTHAHSPDGLMHGVAQGLGVPLAGGDPQAHLAQVIRSRGRCLVVLDNAEQILMPARQAVAHWLSQAPQATVWVTSREVLDLPGETVLQVEALDAAEALDLFRRRMAAARGLGLDDAALDDPVLPSLVQLLDHLPLAIELAAARTRVMTPTLLIARMGERFHLLARRGGAGERQATLEATIEWSWNLLSAAEACTLAQLSVFEGGFTLEQAEAVVELGSSRADSLRVDDLVQSLLDKSLLVRTGPERFGLLVSIQQFAAQRLLELDAEGDTLRRHWTHFSGYDENSISDRHAQDLDNLVAACRRAARMADASCAVSALIATTAGLHGGGPIALALRLVQEVRELTSLSTTQRASVCRVAGTAHDALGQREEALAEFNAGIGLAETAGGDAGPIRARLYCAAADPLVRSGDHDTARLRLDAALRIAQTLDSGPLRYRVLNGLGTLALAQGELDAARSWLEQALQHAQALDHRRWCGGVLGNLGVVAHYAGDLAAAEAHYRASLAIADAVQDRRWAANARCNLALLLSESGQHEQACADFERAVLTAREIGHLHLEATALCNLGQALQASGRSAEAVPPLRQALALALRVGDGRLAAQCQAMLGEGVVEG